MFRENSRITRRRHYSYYYSQFQRVIFRAVRSPLHDHRLWEAVSGMRQGTRRRRRLSSILAVWLGLGQVVFAQPGHEPSNPIRDLKVSDLFVPQDLGYLSDVHEISTPNGPAKLVILIQDAHTNYDAQKHLAKILDRFATDYGIRLVLVEGGVGDVSLSYLRQWGSKDVLQRLAEQYLKTGMISGEEYLDLVSDHPLTLWGIESVDRYEDHFEAFMEVEHVRDAGQGDLTALR